MSFFIVKSVVHWLNVSVSRLIASVAEERACLICYRLLDVFFTVVSVRMSFSSSGCLGKAAYFFVTLPGSSS